eukprot:jgi/Phyca11/13935/fgenesh1_pg.PHYCAscaffold_5_\
MREQCSEHRSEIRSPTHVEVDGNISTTFGRNTELSAMTPPNAVASIDTAVGGEKRSLRYHTNEDLEDDSDDEGLGDAEEEERRGNNMFSTTKLDEMLDGTQVMSRFKKWKAFGYNTYNLPDTIQAKKYKELRTLYLFDSD